MQAMFALSQMRAVKRVHHGQHWVPMWDKNLAGPFQSRAHLPLQAYDLHLERYLPAAEACGAHVDCACLAAGDCAPHSLVILQGIAKTAQPNIQTERKPPTDEGYEGWAAEEKEIWQKQDPIRICFMSWGRGEKSLLGGKPQRRQVGQGQGQRCPTCLPDLSGQANQAARHLKILQKKSCELLHLSCCT